MPDVEIEAMGKVAEALGGLEEEVRARILRWAGERYGVEVVSPGKRAGQVHDDEDDPDDNENSDGSGSGGNGSSPAQQFEHFAELYDAVSPSSDPERVLVAAYWTQVHLGKTTFGSQELNGLLKDLGHGVTSINKAVASNINKKPALLLQVSRGGSSQQARKKAKVTEAGLRWVKARLVA